MKDTLTYLCSKGHLVKAESSSISFDSNCKACKAIERRHASTVENRVAKRRAGLRSGRRV